MYNMTLLQLVFSSYNTLTTFPLNWVGVRKCKIASFHVASSDGYVSANTYNGTPQLVQVISTENFVKPQDVGPYRNSLVFVHPQNNASISYESPEFYIDTRGGVFKASLNFSTNPSSFAGGVLTLQVEDEEGAFPIM